MAGGVRYAESFFMQVHVSNFEYLWREKEMYFLAVGKGDISFTNTIQRIIALKSQTSQAYSERESKL